MEQNLPILTKKLWNMAKIAFLTLRKGIIKKKLHINLNSMLKQQKHYLSHIQYGQISQGPREYEFSCRNTPLYRQYFTNKRSKHQNYLQNQYDFSMASPDLEKIDMKSFDAIDTILGIVLSNKDCRVHHRELRVTDSPFPLRNVEDCDQRVDEVAEEFIKRFYSQIIKQQLC